MARRIPTAILGALAVAAAALMTGPAPAEAQSDLAQIGQLDCQIDPASRQNFIIASNSQIYCSFRNANGQIDSYAGQTGVSIGLDLLQKDAEQLSFLVYSSRTIGSQAPLSLDGQYVGAKAAVAIGQGVGAFVLVGGSNQQFTLAPIGGSSAIGTGVAAGVGFLTLQRTSG